jgi:hypothetical protein
MDCPSKEMWADVLTKPLQGMVFRKIQAELMNCEVNYEDHQEEETARNKSSLTVRESQLCPPRHRRSVLGKIGQTRSNGPGTNK